MKNPQAIKDTAKQTIFNEARAIDNLVNYIDEDFVNSVNVIFNSAGRVIVTGIGKSANIAAKIVATLNSTGTPSIFMHAADAIHGDLGIVQKDDVVICISKSGNTPEIKLLVPILKSLGNILIALVGNTDSFLAKQADYILNSTVEKEACPNNLAPTTSTTAQLVIGDALAVCLLEQRGFSVDDFAKYHPGGALGKQLYLKVSDLFIHNDKPQVDINDDIRSTILEISSKRLGATAVLENGKLAGIITDGDIRRMIQNNTSVNGLNAKDIMNKNPKTIDSNVLAVDALNLMRQKNITQLIVLKDETYAGIVHLHDILREGLI